MSEWYANSTLGLEQGFLLQRRPAGRGELTLKVGLTGSLAAEATQHGQTISFGSLVYRGLVVTDARGRTIPARLQLAGQRVLITVADRTALYPIRIDPFVELAELTASDGVANDALGISVAVSGDTIAAGAPFHQVGSNSYQGAVYVFTSPSGGWADATQTAELTATDGAAGDDSARASRSTETRSPRAAPTTRLGGNSQQGATYVFTKPVSGWTDATQTAELTATDGAANDALGFSVAVSGNAVAAGAPYHQVGTNSFQGAAYVFTKPVSGWANATQSAELTATDGVTGDLLGSSVAMSGDTIAASAIARKVGGNEAQGAVYVFTKPVGGWTNATQTAELTATDGAANDALGFSVAVSGDTIVAGAFGHTVGGNSYRGAAYVFTKPVGSWANATQTAELTAADGAPGDEFGISVGVSGATIVVGAFGHSVGGNSNQGAVYLFTKPGGGWTDATETDKLSAPDGATGDELGSNVAIDAAAIAAGAPYHQVGDNVGQGAVYSFTESTKASPSISTVQQPAIAAVGSSIADKATVTGGYNPTGTVTFKLYNNPNGTGTPLFTDTEPLVDGSRDLGRLHDDRRRHRLLGRHLQRRQQQRPRSRSGTADEPVTVTTATPSIITTSSRPRRGRHLDRRQGDRHRRLQARPGRSPSSSTTTRTARHAAVHRHRDARRRHRHLGRLHRRPPPAPTTGSPPTTATATTPRSPAAPAAEPVTVDQATPAIITTPAAGHRHRRRLDRRQGDRHRRLQPDRHGHLQALQQPQRHRHAAVHRHRAARRAAWPPPPATPPPPPAPTTGSPPTTATPTTTPSPAAPPTSR